MKKMNKLFALMFVMLCCAICPVAVGSLVCSVSSTVHANNLLVNLSFFNDAWNFIKTNWLWFAIGGGALVLLIIVICIIAGVKKRKKKAKIKAEQAKQEANALIEGTENEEPNVTEAEKTENEDVVLEENAEDMQNAEADTAITDAFALNSQQLPQEQYGQNMPVNANQSGFGEYDDLRRSIEEQRQQIENEEPLLYDEQDEELARRLDALQREYEENLNNVNDALFNEEQGSIADEIKKEQERIEQLEAEYSEADQLLKELSEQEALQQKLEQEERELKEKQETAEVASNTQFTETVNNVADGTQSTETANNVAESTHPTETANEVLSNTQSTEQENSTANSGNVMPAAPANLPASNTDTKTEHTNTANTSNNANNEIKFQININTGKEEKKEQAPIEPAYEVKDAPAQSQAENTAKPQTTLNEQSQNVPQQPENSFNRQQSYPSFAGRDSYMDEMQQGQSAFARNFTEKAEPTIQVASAFMQSVPTGKQNLEEENLAEKGLGDVKVVSNDAVVINDVKKLSVLDAFQNLSAKQKQYFNKLRDYADIKPNSRAKITKNYISVGNGNKNYIRLSIKRNITIASFLSENEEMLRLRLTGELPLKAEEVQIKVVDDKSFQMAKQMIDLREKQIEKENEIIKEIRREKRRKKK